MAALLAIQDAEFGNSSSGEEDQPLEKAQLAKNPGTQILGTPQTKMVLHLTKRITTLAIRDRATGQPLRRKGSKRYPRGQPPNVDVLVGVVIVLANAAGAHDALE